MPKVAHGRSDTKIVSMSYFSGNSRDLLNSMLYPFRAAWLRAPVVNALIKRNSYFADGMLAYHFCCN